MTLVDPELVLDSAARARILDRFGVSAGAWCDRLPAVVDRLVRRWALEVVAAAPGGTGRTLLCLDAAGQSVVVKLTPEFEIAATEAAALTAWADCSRVVDLLDADLAVGALLLRGIVPGTPLAYPWFGHIAELLEQLHAVVVPPQGFVTLAQRLEMMFALAERRLRGSAAEAHLPPELLARSRAAALALAADGPVSLLHGDLHSGNVLDGGSGPIAIDPRPCLGDPTFDAVDWALLPVREGGSVDDGIAALCGHLPSLDADRLHRWCAATAVLMALGPLRHDGPTAYTDSLLRLA